MGTASQAYNKVTAETIRNQTRLIKNLLKSASHELQTLNEQSKGHVERLNWIINVTNSNQKSIVISNLITTAEISITEYN